MSRISLSNYSIGRIFKRLTMQFCILPMVKTKSCLTFNPLENSAGFHFGIFEIAATIISSIFASFDGMATLISLICPLFGNGKFNGSQIITRKTSCLNIFNAIALADIESFALCLRHNTHF